MEAATRLYQVALTSSATLNDDVVLDSDLNKNFAGQVACRAYDPWAETHRRYKKLLLDAASAVVTGVAQVPLFLDLTPSTPRVASFKQLLDSDAVRLDPVFWHDGWKKTLYADLGSLTGAPCMISISEGGALQASDKSYVFKGISAGLCTSRSENHTLRDGAAVTTAKASRQSVCGACSLNFATVSTAAARSGFGVLGSGIRMMGALVQFFKSNKDPFSSPKSLTITASSAPSEARSMPT